MFSLSVLLSSPLLAGVSGTVYQELPASGTTLNSYGIKDVNELGVEGVSVTAFMADSNQSTVTDSNGSWSLNTTGDVRVEFSNFPEYLKESTDGGGVNSSVQFAVDGSSIDFGLHDPSDYSDTATPDYVTNRQQNGSGESNSNPSIERIHYSDSGLNSQFTANDGNVGTGAVPTKDAEVQDVGSVWGKAYQKDQKRLFVSAMLQRHVGFAPNKGAGEIYVISYQNNPSDFKGSFTLQGVTPASGAEIDLGSVCRSSACKDDAGNTGKETDYILSAGVGTPNIDLDAFAKVGRVSYGDIEFDQSTDTLWLVNLNQKGLISLDAKGDFASLSSATTNHYAIESLPNSPSCTDGELIPWALTIHRGRGYLGAICNAFTSQKSEDLHAYVLSFDPSNPSTGFTNELDFALNYDKDNKPTERNWHSWSDTDQKENGGGSWNYYQQPILSDIEFDEKNTMYLSFLDRYSIQAGHENYEPISDTNETNERTFSRGEIFRVCDNNGTFELEQNGTCTEFHYDVSGNVHEFFNDRSGDDTREASLGSLALLKGSNQMLLSVTDPHPEGSVGQKYYETSGTNTLSTLDGSIQNWYANTNNSDENDGYNGKAGGMGDIELLTAPAPVEVGNRVWFDDDSDGIQDANETGISGITVELVCGGNSISAVTDSEGNYIFSNDPNGISTDNRKYNIASLFAGVTDCLIRVPNISGGSQQAGLSEKILTTKGVGEGTNSNLNDSDGIIVGEGAEANITASSLPLLGVNNHSFDFGFAPSPLASIGNFVWNDTNKNGVQDAGEGGESNISVTLLKDCSTNVGTTQTDGTGHYLFSGLDPANYCIEFSNLPTDYVVTTKGAGGDRTKDSDVNSGTLKTDDTDLIASENDMSWDMGIYNSKASIGNFVWIDSNKNGQQDGGESGLKDFEVVLYSSNCSTKINTTTTDATGQYLFSNLDTGDYCIGVENIPSGYAITEVDKVGVDDTLDSDIDPNSKVAISTHLDEGEDNRSWDIGLYALSTIGDKVWHDKNANGLQEAGEEGIADVAVKLLKDCTSETNSTTTSATGEYLFVDIDPADYCVEFTLPAGYIVTKQDIGADNVDSDVNATTLRTAMVSIAVGENRRDLDMGLYRPATIGDRVWLDSNGNGIQDNNESGVGGVTVTLSRGCSVDIDVIVTDQNGTYLFTGVTPDSYCLEFSTIPADHFIVTQDATGDNLDSDVDPVTARTINIDLLSNANDTSWDMGLSQHGSIGNRVWIDSDADGVQDTNETIGVDSVKVTLFRDCDDARAITEVNSTRTDNSGRYLFPNLSANNYCVEFTELPNGANITPANQTVDSNDSDANPATGRTPARDLNSGDQDMSIDMGIYQLSSLGDRAWYDKNKNGIQDNNESGVKDLNVTLYAEDCTTELETTVTDANGTYLFANLMPKRYCLGFAGFPTGYVITKRDMGVDTNDSDIDPTTHKSILIYLNSGIDDMSWDIGIHEKPAVVTPPSSGGGGGGSVGGGSTALPPLPSLPTEESSDDDPVKEPTAEPEEEESGGKIFIIRDDEIEANTNGSVTTIPVLGNDDEEAIDQTIHLLSIADGEALYSSDGTAIAGANVQTMDELYVEGEGTWRVVGGAVTFTAQDGFNGTPTPIYYIVKDANGNQSNIAQIKIITSCSCEDYELSAKDAVPVFNSVSIFIMMIFITIFAWLFFREKEEI